MILFKTKNYIKNTFSLSKKNQMLLIEQEKLLEKNIFYPKLHTKKLKSFTHDTVFSFRISRAYRAIFRLSDQRIILFAIGHRKDIYNNL